MLEEAINLIEKQIEMNKIQEQNIKTWAREKSVADCVRNELYENIRVWQFIHNILEKEKTNDIQS